MRPDEFASVNYAAVSITAEGEPKTAGQIFTILSGKSWYRTVGFKEVGYVHGSVGQAIEYCGKNELI